MVMIFAEDLARNHLLEKGFVVTFRKNPRQKVGMDWMNDGRGRPKICDIFITTLECIDSYEGLIPYLEHSGFHHVWSWADAIRRLNKVKHIRGFLYLVIKT